MVEFWVLHYPVRVKNAEANLPNSIGIKSQSHTFATPDADRPLRV